MRARLLRAGLLFLCTALAFSACGDSTDPDAQSEFNDFEANQVLNAVASVIENVDTGAPGLAASVEPIISSVNCGVGGTAAIDGTRDPGPAVDFDARVTFTSCASASVTINGILDITGTSATTANGVIVTWTYLGTVTSKKDGRTRSCTMDATRKRTISNGTTTLSTTGTLCGRHVNS